MVTEWKTPPSPPKSQGCAPDPRPLFLTDLTWGWLCGLWQAWQTPKRMATASTQPGVPPVRSAKQMCFTCLNRDENVLAPRTGEGRVSQHPAPGKRGQSHPVLGVLEGGHNTDTSL